MDAKGAYLNGYLKESVYMRQPDGYDDGTGHICHLVKTLYGLKQARHEWNKVLDHKLKAKGFKPLLSDPCAYIRRNGEDLEIITVWVNDLLLFMNSNEKITNLKVELNSMFDLTDIGESNKIVGIKITHCANSSIFISQKQYIKSILKREGMLNASPVKTPLDLKILLESNPEGEKGNRSNAFARLISSLQYLSTATRPDITYAVNQLSAYTANPSMAHYTAAK